MTFKALYRENLDLQCLQRRGGHLLRPFGTPGEEQSRGLCNSGARIRSVLRLEC